ASFFGMRWRHRAQQLLPLAGRSVDRRRGQEGCAGSEAGFPSLKDPHREPWSEAPRALSVDDQARCYEAVLRAFYKKPWFQGVYWWKVGTNGMGGPQDGSHTPWRKPAMD